MKEDQLINSVRRYFETVMAAMRDRFFVPAVFLWSSIQLLSCGEQKSLAEQQLYEGPLVEMDSIYTKMSDSAKIKVILSSPKQKNFDGGDREWPQGLYLEYLNDTGGITSTFKADYVYYTSKDQLYRAEGNVVVRNTEDGDELNTEQLFWSPKDKEFFTERFVTIQSDDEIHTGEGLRADEDFSYYKILKPQGTISVEE